MARQSLRAPLIVPTLEELRIERDRRRCRGSFAEFVKAAWHVLEPETPLIWNWHMQAVCDHLQALVDGVFLELGLPNRLLINVPPGTSKSLLTSVLLQAWEWGPAGRPTMRYLSTSYNDGPVNRDTRKCRDLILSDWYQARWPEVYLVRRAETSFANDRTGTRQGVAFGSLTSQRGDRLVIDDPHSTETAESEADRISTTRRFREGAQNRLNDQKRSCIIVIMQRLHEADVSGVIEQIGMNYVRLVLPMEFEPERKCVTPLGFEDPRTVEGEILDPVRFPPEEVANLKRDLGSYGYAGQYQQRPAPREGGMFQRAWFEFVGAAQANTRFIRGWDLAATKSAQAAYTAGVKIGRQPDGTYVIANCVRAQESPGGVDSMIRNTASQDGKSCGISLPQDPGQAGKAQVQYLIRRLAGYNVKASPESGDKAQRAEPLSAQAEAGNVKILRTGDPAKDAWIEPFLEELCLFPNSKFKDQTDAASRAFNEIASPGGESGTVDLAGFY